jgi:hypothetical protein
VVEMYGYVIQAKHEDFMTYRRSLHDEALLMIANSVYFCCHVYIGCICGAVKELLFVSMSYRAMS